MKKIKLSDKQKKITKISLNVLQIAIIVVTVAISVLTIISTNSGSSQLASGIITKTSYLPVLSDSMAPSINEGDLIIAKAPKDKNALNVGDIITFSAVINGRNEINTHRIIEKTTNELGDQIIYTTHGDNAPEGTNEEVYANTVLAVYSGRIQGLGRIILWLQNPTNFFLIIMIPLILLFLFNGYSFAKIIINIKLKKASEEQNKNKLSEEEIKRQAVEEYLAKENSK